jgi:ABC-type dipeptide/oligopeptide/nickel transport system ATPase component
MIEYIWVKEFKGFKNQGFRLNDACMFDYNLESSILSIKNNVKYISNLYGPRVLSATCLVGNNGAGKTNFLELVQYMVNGANTKVSKAFFVVTKNLHGQRVIYTHRINDLKCKGVKILKYDGNLPKVQSVYFSNVFDGRDHGFNIPDQFSDSGRVIDLSFNDLILQDVRDPSKDEYKKLMQKQIEFLQHRYTRKIIQETESKLSEIYKIEDVIPSNIRLTTPSWRKIYARSRHVDKKLQGLGYTSNLHSYAKTFRSDLRDLSPFESFKYFTAFLVYYDFILSLKELKGKDILRKDSANEQNVIKTFIENQPLPFDGVHKTFDYITKDFAFLADSQFGVFETQKFLFDLREIDSSLLKMEKNDVSFSGSYSDSQTVYNLPFNDRVGSLLTKYIDTLSFDGLGFDIDWGGISSGQKAYLNLFSRFFSITGQLRPQFATILCMDEIDLYFHPKWQVDLIFKLVNILPEILDKDVQIVLTTHSPFLVSDFTKENLIQLIKREDRLIIQPLEENVFGGNVGELYLDAFDLKGKLVSSLAEKKIKDIYTKLKNKQELSNSEKLLIDELGEDLIQTQLHKMIS